MKRLLPIVLVLLSGAPSHAAVTTTLKAAAASALVLEGSSNVTGWRCRGTSLDGQMTVAAPMEKINAVIDRIEDGNIGVWMANPSEGRFPQPQFSLHVPVSALECGNGRMERDLGRALKADRYPNISFRFKTLVGNVEHDIDANLYRARIAGELTLAGARRDIEVNVVARRIGRSRFRITAELPLRMTDFGITPPTALFGMVTARDGLVVRFDLLMNAEAAT